MLVQMTFKVTLSSPQGHIRNVWYNACNLHELKRSYLHSVRMSAGRACSGPIVEAISFGSHVVVEIIWLRLLLL